MVKSIKVTQREFIDNIYDHNYFASENNDKVIEFFKWIEVDCSERV